MSSVSHMDNRSHNQRVILAILGNLRVTLILKEIETSFSH